MKKTTATICNLKRITKDRKHRFEILDGLVFFNRKSITQLKLQSVK